MARGGIRPGAGRPKGSKSRSTIDKEAQRELLRQRVVKAFGPLIDAQISNATGIKYLVVREKKTGKFLRVGRSRAEQLNPEEEVIEVWEKEPSIQAFADLMNRTLDRPAEHVELTGADQGPISITFQWMNEAAPSAS